MEKQKEQKKSRLSSIGRHISLLVAVLVMAALVGSLVFVISAAHQNTARHSNTTNVGAAQTAGFGKTVYTKSDTSQTGFEAFAWSPDSSRVASLTLDGVQIWDATTGKNQVTVSLPSGVFAAYALAWSPKSQLLAIGTNASLLLVNGQTGAVVKSYPVNTVAETRSPVGSSTLLSAQMPASGGNGVSGLAWSHDGSSLAVIISDGPTSKIQVLNPQTGTVDYTLPVTGNKSPDVTVSWSADDKYVAAGVSNEETGPGPVTTSSNHQEMVWVWNTATKQVVFQHTGSTSYGSLAWSPNSDTLAFSVTQTKVSLPYTLLTLWNAATNQVTSYQDSTTGPLAWSPDGKYIVFAGTTHLSDSIAPQAPLVSIIDASTGKLVYEYTQMDKQVSTLAWSPDGHYIVSGEGNTNGACVARVWTAE